MPGKVTQIAASSSPMSIPSSSASVATTASSSPAGEPRLDLAPLLRRVAAAVGRDPRRQLRLAAPRPASRGRSAGSARSRAGSCRKQIVRTPCETSSASRSAASERAERRVPVALSISGGFHIAISRPARGAPSSSISSNGVPTSRSASSTGLAIVAEASRKRGSAP